MPEPLADRILRKIGEVDGLYHRLVIVVAPSGGGKTAALQEVAERTGYPRININLELSRRLARPHRTSAIAPGPPTPQ